MNPVPPRAKALRAISAPEFDVIVVGGGIVGAGVARDAARRGFRTALIERDDFASGTSSRSSRLIHGGVRYLEHGWFHLVFEASRERRRLLDNAPHLVRPLRFTWPVYDHQRLAKWEIGAGLLMYDVLALYRNVGKHKRMTPDDVLEREPRVLTRGLEGGATYWDAATDDARLTIANVIDAERAGAELLNHAEVTGLSQSGGRADGVIARDGPSGMTLRIRGRVVVNATGPWTDMLRREEDPKADAAVRGTKGVHLLVPQSRIGNIGALTLLHPADERVVFALPAGANTILGTTDTRTGDPPDQVRACASDVQYLLDAANHFFPAASLSEDDVISAWAGLRPLIASSKADQPAAQSREHEIVVGPLGVIGVSGGKLTTYRSMAEEIVDVVAEQIHRREKSDTAHATLPGGELPDVSAEIAVASDICGDAAIATHLVHTHGSEWRSIWALGSATPALRERIAPECNAIRGELINGVRNECARTLADLLVRRTHIAFETRDHGVSVAPQVAALVAHELGWNAAVQSAAVAEYVREVERLFTIDAC